MRKRSMGVLSCGWSSRTRFDLNARRPVLAHSLLGLFLGLAEQELPDEPLEHHRRLRDGDAVALGELLVVAARLQADIALAQQPRGEDRRRGVLGERVT